jgi:AcrR family transcriptional regulator
MKPTRGAATRQRILETAWDLFHKQGIHLTSPSQIMEISGTGQGQFYQYFKNKDGLVHAVMLAHLEAMKAGKSPIK